MLGTEIEIVLLNGVEKPKYETAGSVGLDIRARNIKAVFKGSIGKSESQVEYLNKRFKDNGYHQVRGYERVLFGTDLRVNLEHLNTEFQIRSRSGLALNKGLVVLNSPGTIDPDHTKEICVLIYNTSKFLARVDFNDRIAQMVLNEVGIAKFKIVDELSVNSLRGGFGHTGLK